MSRLVTSWAHEYAGFGKHALGMALFALGTKKQDTAQLLAIHSAPRISG
jgi:hypothetical protein